MGSSSTGQGAESRGETLLRAVEVALFVLSFLTVAGTGLARAGVELPLFTALVAL
jgi:hypothetical protein